MSACDYSSSQNEQVREVFECLEKQTKQGSSKNGFDEDVAPQGKDNEAELEPAEGEETEAVIAQYDVVLGNTHTPTIGTELYRAVRRPYGKKQERMQTRSCTPRNSAII